ncbi:Lymphatic vessel endothelial hyaluronic acid receptor 1 [Nibea albiflora]|uniref:Lymphatic vessel endothelial hyaluronic acid receptor 1 n=1 Tax=Nibea albiflora TaxID=240163 RepID=A0ACB7EI78_NIBAL|nr:Lymphatic vessel endothelial hyaluronic acid receptor 1 [Nibea albiflora]
MIWLCITLVSITQIICDQNIDTSRIRVFPAVNKSIAGVFQVSYTDDFNQLQYAFNASEARALCLSLGVNIASKAQVKDALSRGLETCRFGWIDEHFGVIPRRKALSNCGQNQTGLVTWRASVTQKFDVFCFNESDAATQLKDTTTDSPLHSGDYSGQTQFPSKAVLSTLKMHSTSSSSLLPSSSSTPSTLDNEVEPARFVGGIQGSAGVRSIISFFLSVKRRRNRSLSADIKQQEEYIQTEEWTCVKTIKETKITADEDERIDVDDNAT